MNKLFRIYLLIAVTFSFAGNMFAGVTIHGRITNPKNNKVYVKYYREYLTYQVDFADSATLDKNGDFSMTFNWPSSYPAEFLHGDEVTPLFLSPGYDLKITLDVKRFDESVKYSGKGADVNNYLALKVLNTSRISAMVIYKMPEKEFTHLIDSIYEKDMALFNKWRAKADKKDSNTLAFINYEHANLIYTWATQKEYYPQSYTYFTKNEQVLPANYYEFKKQAPIPNTTADLSSAYLRYVHYSIFKDAESRRILDSARSSLEHAIDVIDQGFTGELKEYLYVQQVKSLLERGDMNSAYQVFDRYKTFAKNEKYLSVLEQVFSATQSLMPGKDAPDFTAVDLNGNKVQLSNYKGRLVYIDVWASWCGPCVREIPYAEKLQEELKGKDIVFLCVSVDDNEAAWKNIIKQRNIGGVHVRSAGDQEANVSSLYNVSGIPHYMIIGKDGKIVDANAKRPSQDVRWDLEKLLK